MERNGIERRTVVIVLLSLVMLCAVATTACVVWPTRYRHDHMSGFPVRVDRFTGRTEVLFPYGWRVLDDAAGWTADDARSWIRAAGTTDED